MRNGRPVIRTEKSYVLTGAGCWIWEGAVSSSGYGSKVHKGKAMVAHRFVYEQLVGPIPEGKQLNHMCDIKLCVNPDHMVIGTQKQNVADMNNRGRRNQYSKITIEQARRVKYGEESASLLSKELNLSVTCINYIRAGKTWKRA